MEVDAERGMCCPGRQKPLHHLKKKKKGRILAFNGKIGPLLKAYRFWRSSGLEVLDCIIPGWPPKF